MTDPRARLATTVEKSSDVGLIGDILQQISVMRSNNHGLVSFVTPSIAHLALGAAVTSAHLANAHRSSLVTRSPSRTVFLEQVNHIEDGEIHGALFDTFLHAMSASIFSYLALENFANEVIGRHPEALIDTRERMVRKKSERRRERTIRTSAREAEKESLGFKLSDILPQITSIPIEKGREPYQSFKKLEQIRHGVIHMKSKASVPRPRDIGKVDKQPVWDDFVHENSLWMPNSALQIMRHFRIDTLPLDWLSDIEVRIKSESMVTDCNHPSMSGSSPKPN